LKGIMC